MADSLAEPTLWKGLLMRDNKFLLNANTALKNQVKELTRRVGAAEDVAKLVKGLDDRVGALEDDEREMR